MALGIDGKFPILFRIVFELRYKNGFTYLDRCGKTINTIQEESPEWIIGGSPPNPQASSLVSIESACKFSFGSYKLDVSLDKPLQGEDIKEERITDFMRAVDYLSAVVIDHLSLATFSRIGCRVWYLFPCESKADAEKWVIGLGLVTPSAHAAAAAFGGSPESIQFSLGIQGEDRRYRLAADTVERTTQLDIGDAVLNFPVSQVYKLPPSERKDAIKERGKARKHQEHSPQYAAMVDVDCFQEEPLVVKPIEFATTSYETVLKSLRVAVEKSKKSD